MSQPPPESATEILNQLAAGESSAWSRLLPLVYEELRSIAGHYMKAERSDHTLQPTALVHEAYLRLVDVEGIAFNGRQHFIAVAARAMRRLLVNHARDRRAARRGGGEWQRITLEHAFTVTKDNVIDVLDLDTALEALGELHERQARLSELRFFGGLEVAEAAEVLGIGLSTAKRDWTIARAWLTRRLAITES